MLGHGGNIIELITILETPFGIFFGDPYKGKSAGSP
jgi:hypothetical protein